MQCEINLGSNSVRITSHHITSLLLFVRPFRSIWPFRSVLSRSVHGSVGVVVVVVVGFCVGLVSSGCMSW
jgi:hypothetical protein